MSPEVTDPSVRLLAEWRRLTEAESVAIDGGAWEHVLRHQAAKARLRADYEAAARTAGWPDRQPLPHADARRMLGDLLVLEERNRVLLTRRLEASRAERLSAEQHRRTLRRMQRVLGPGPTNAAWQQFS